MTRAPIAMEKAAKAKRPEPPPLSDFLTRAYCAQNMIKAPGADAVEAVADVAAEFQKCATNYKTLLVEAKAERDRLRGIPANRCHISRTHGAFLTTALEGL
jgi:hypothetical protein